MDSLVALAIAGGAAIAAIIGAWLKGQRDANVRNERRRLEESNQMHQHRVEASRDAGGEPAADRLRKDWSR